MAFQLIAKFEWIGDTITLIGEEEETHQQYLVLYKGTRCNFPHEGSFPELRTARTVFVGYCGEITGMTSSSDMSIYFQQKAKDYVPEPGV